MNLTTSKIGTILEDSGKERDFASPAYSRPSRPSLEIRARPFDGTNVEPADIQNLLSSEEQDF